MTRLLTVRAAAATMVGALVAASGAIAAQAAVAPPPATTARPPQAAETPVDVGATDRIIVRYRTQPTTGVAGAQLQSQRRDQVQETAESQGVVAEFVRSTSQGAQVWTLDEMMPIDDAAALASSIAASDPAVEYAEPDRIMVPLADAPNDPSWSDQWALQTTDAGLDVLGAWDVARGAGVNVAVIDTGYLPHADLAANILGGYDMISDTAVSHDGSGRDNDARDPGDHTSQNECGNGRSGSSSSWHGTHVAGIIAAVTGNGVGVSGVAPESKVVPVRVLGACGGYTADIADAMVWASGGTVPGAPTNANPARVLNLSLGGSGTCGTTTQNAINTARANGAVVVVAAGNGASDVSTTSPANCSGVVAVAAYGPTGSRASYSNYGSLVDLAAPGGDSSSGASGAILSTLNAGTTDPGSDSYEYYQGTSMAAPHVAAVAALMISANPDLTVEEVETLLRSSARPFVGSCSSCGSGMLDASAAVHAAVGGASPEPTPAPDPTPDPTPEPTPEPDPTQQPTPQPNPTQEPTPASVTEVEPNDSRGAANVLAESGAVAGAIGAGNDTDWFAVSLPAGASLTATLTPNVDSDYDLYLYGSSGRRVASSLNEVGAADTATVRNTRSSSRTYYVRVVYYSGGTGATDGAYGLDLDW
jgi:serine protease